ncbi:hypothetical protein PRZ48_012688 [Zasmidium cellare]|uniref:Cation efflux protein transmembrane domain-containing protein n=1 Tax=Zasmidium cellare TaxID=395010 RepID=A0ABR0E638_ZASCE|nr:hypothetical protein PRZ48_012688 [Zasmidium cellare]
METIPNFAIETHPSSPTCSATQRTALHESDATTKTSKEPSKATSPTSDVERITRIALLANLALAVSNAVGGYMLGSQALIADAVHALTDLAADFVALVAARCSMIHGLEKSEAIGGLAVSGIVVSGGFALVMHAMLVLCEHFDLDVLAGCLSYLTIFSHDNHSKLDTGSSFEAIILPLVSILVKEWLYQATMKAAKRSENIMLESHALHQRLDVITAVVALVANAASQLDARLAWLDGFGGLVIGVMIFKAGCSNAIAALQQLSQASRSSRSSNFKKH